MSEQTPASRPPVGPPVGLPVGEVVAGWTSRERARAVPLAGRYVDLEPLATAHAADLHAALCGPGDADLWTYRVTPMPPDVATTTALVETLLADPAVETFVAVPHGGRPSGVASYMRIDTAHGQVEIGGVLWGRRMQGTAASTEAVHLAMAHAFDDLGYRRFEWKCDALNEPSRRAAARLGFRFEGRFRQHLVVKGRNRDTDWFSVTDVEWPDVRAAHLTWLDGLDADLRQAVSLSTLTAPLLGQSSLGQSSLNPPSAG